MSFRISSKYSSILDLSLKIGKISIITFFGIMVIANFVPYFVDTPDSYVYGLKSISLTEGTWSTTNFLLEETGKWEYVPTSWKKTIDDTAIPKYFPGLPIIGAIFYSIGDVPALFYLGPIFAIILLITSERISTKLFGKYVGFLTLLFMATNGYVFDTGRYLLSDNIFVLFSLLGIFYLILFFRNKKSNSLVFASVFLMLSCFVRPSGIIYFPMEIIMIIAFFTIEFLKKRDEKIFSKINVILKIKNSAKISVIVILPWLIFIIFVASFNYQYFDDPLINYYNISGDPFTFGNLGTGSFFSIFEPSHENFDIVKSYSNYVLPYPIYRIGVLDLEHTLEERSDPITSILLELGIGFVGNNILGIITFVVLILSIILAMRFKKNRIEILIFSFVILVNIIFWSANHISLGRDSVMGRYMMVTFPLFSMILGYLIIEFLRIKFLQNNFKKIILGIKICVIIITVMFFSVAIFNSAPVHTLINNGLIFNNPIEEATYYPLDKEGLDEFSIIVGGTGHKVVDYGFTTFNWSSSVPLLRAGFDPTTLSDDSMNMLKQLVIDDYDVYMFKKPLHIHDLVFREYIIEHYGLILIENSQSFCKFNIIEQTQKIDYKNNKENGSCYKEIFE